MRISMFYFTGTGFTERVAERLSAEFRDQGQDVHLNYIPEMLQKLDKGSGEPIAGGSDFDRIGILYPVHSFNAPEIVIRFAKLLPSGNGKSAFIVKTAGGKSRFNKGSSLLLKKVLARKGYKTVYEEVIQMPSNFIVRYDDDTVRQIVGRADDLVKIVAEEIVKGRKKTFKPGIDTRITAVLGRAEWTGARFVGKFHLKVTDRCNLCGKCVSECPTRNISMDSGKIKFGSDCTFCMRCIYGCPQKAIHLKRPFSGIEVKDWFDIDELMGK